MRKIIGFMLASVMIFAFAACHPENELEEYKTAAKTEIEAYIDGRRDDYSTANRIIVWRIIETGKTAVDAADNKPDVDIAVATAKAEIDAVEIKTTGPSYPEILAGFTDEFFEDNTIILIPFQWTYLLYDYLEFYTVYVESGKMNFLIEVTDPYGGGNAAIDHRLFAVIISNEIFGKYEIGEMITFKTYSRMTVGNETRTIANDREWLKEIDEKSVEHSAYIFDSDSGVYRSVYEITIVTSEEGLKEIFYI